MADTLVTDETPKTSLTGTEEIYINDSGADKKASITNVRGGASQTELGYVSGVTSAIQTQLDKKRVIIKQSDETIISDDTLSNDSELFFSVAANTRYVGILTLWLTSGTTPDIKWAFTLPSGATGTRAVGALSSIPQVMIDITTSFNHTTSGAKQVTVLTFEISTSSTAGTVNFQWAQNTNTASNTTIHAGSSLVVFNQ